MKKNKKTTYLCAYYIKKERTGLRIKLPQWVQDEELIFSTLSIEEILPKIKGIIGSKIANEIINNCTIPDLTTLPPLEGYNLMIVEIYAPIYTELILNKSEPLSVTCPSWLAAQGRYYKINFSQLFQKALINELIQPKYGNPSLLLAQEKDKLNLKDQIHFNNDSSSNI